ncbi:MazG nucleotide pyrophosphohydrolase domain-containing protein [Iamia majanohamensis]|uniref:MazG nucleotide pyrophosphohydrolase domain-containing protein n=1 Tax=Iamia majanohamensis TaxID=467976 RepID=A0AAE9YIC1_9ACTN|nr:MazG nucleotide pyrophosphohydrolase domain-containing protein [Iamia majanohamensis]WCO68426.1 MazG nucleotide pyrophosphohydrolase domain-containing protein [Iamia majanohamensis]
MTPRIVACGLGPAGADLVTRETADLLGSGRPVRLRTTRHPAVAQVAPDAPGHDHHYEAAATFAEVYRRIVDDLVAEAGEHGELVYAVPGSPRVLERTVDLLAERASAGEVELDVRPALSFLDLAWVRLGIDPLEEGVRLVDGHRFATAAAGQRGPLLVAHCHNRRVLSDIKLAVEDPPDEPVLVVQRLGSPDEAVTEVAWADLDRSVEPDHLTSLYVPALAAPVAAEVVAFAELVRTLREQCPWDREQTHVTLTRHALEEAYEVVEAITAWDAALGTDAEVDADEHLAEELGDLLFQVVFHATLGAERGAFDLADVARGIHDKLVRRHPHVFPPEGVEAGGDTDVASLTRTWEEIKRAETGRTSVMDGLPDDLPSLLWAHKVLRKAEAAGQPWTPNTTAAADDLGEQLLALVHAARAADVDPETALRTAAARVRDQVRATEGEPPAP